MNIVFYILALIVLFTIWLLATPVFNKIGELALNIYNKIKNIIKGDNNNE